MISAERCDRRNSRPGAACGWAWWKNRQDSCL